MINTDNRSQGFFGSIIVSAFFILAGLMTFYDTISYSDVDSKVFPRAVAIILIICASISFVTTLLKPQSEGGFGQGCWWRRSVLVFSMLLACYAMPHLGFLLAGAIAFYGGLIAAMHDPWTWRKVWLYSGTGAAVMIIFYALFRYLLHVPLP